MFGKPHSRTCSRRRQGLDRSARRIGRGSVDPRAGGKMFFAVSLQEEEDDDPGQDRLVDRDWRILKAPMM